MLFDAIEVPAGNGHIRSWVGWCPCHDDRAGGNRSLDIDLTAKTGIVGVLIYCRSCGANGEAVRLAAGLSWVQLRAELLGPTGADANPGEPRGGANPAARTSRSSAAGRRKNVCRWSDADVARWNRALVANDVKLQWLLDRGLSREVIDDYWLGWRPYPYGYSIPVYRGEELTAGRWYRPWFEDKRERRLHYGPPFAQCPLYPDVPASGWVLLCEGEWDALCARSHGLPGVSGIGGAGYFAREWAAALVGKRVVVCYDCDEAGRRGAQKVADLLPDVPTVFDLDPTRTDGWDLSDFFKEGGSSEDLVRQMRFRRRGRGRSTVAERSPIGVRKAPPKRSQSQALDERL